MPQPTKKTLTADTSAQKNFSWPRPKGCSRSGPPRPRTSPIFSSTWLPTSASEWIVSANSVGEPVTNQPNALLAAIAELVAIDSVTEEDIWGDHARICPEPSTIHFSLVSPSRPTGPRACSLLVEMPISAPSPYSKPSAKRVDAFTITELESTSRRKRIDRKSTRLNSSHVEISYAVFCLKKKKKSRDRSPSNERQPGPAA